MKFVKICCEGETGQYSESMGTHLPKPISMVSPLTIAIVPMYN